MKISQRLQHINAMINDQYEHIWDCCCDHGLLGAALLKRHAAKQIHFVDVVSELMCDLEKKLQRFYPPSLSNNNSQWQVHCLDVGQLNLAEKNQRQLIIIAGVGGDLTVTLVKQIIERHPEHDLEFILCPVHHIYKVRSAMHQLGLGLIDEYLMQENGRFYEVLHLASHSQTALSPVGSIMWDFEHEQHQDYLRNTLEHYQRIADGLAKAPQSITESITQQTEQAFIERVITEYQSLMPSSTIPR